jgi:hypothetical protein
VTRLRNGQQIILVRSPAGVRDIFLPPKLQADCRAQWASCLIDTNSPLSEGKAAREWELSTHLRLILKLKIQGTNFHTFLWYARIAQGKFLQCAIIIHVIINGQYL